MKVEKHFIPWPCITEEAEAEWRRCPFEIWYRNPAFPPLSDALAIGFNEEGGRHIVATRSIVAGEAIVIEEPVTAHLSPCFMAKNCSHCLRRIGISALPSPLHSKARFCSWSCLQEAMDTYHRIESQLDVNQLFYDDSESSAQMSGCISLAYRAVTQKPLAFFLQHKDTLFGKHDVKFGIDLPHDFSYIGHHHYK